MRVWNGAGTWDVVKRGWFPWQVYIHKTVTVTPRIGPNEAWRWGDGWGNRCGLTNPGIERFTADVLPKLPGLLDSTQWLGVSIFGTHLPEWEQLARTLDAERAVDIIELNLSCPNVENGDLAQVAADIIGRARAATIKPLAAKLAPTVTVDVARACEAAGADTLVLCNSLATPIGGLSGLPIRSLVLDLIDRTAPHVGIPIVGLGGIETPGDYSAFTDAGATDVAVGSGAFLLRGPAAG